VDSDCHEGLFLDIMNLEIHFREMESTEALKTHIEEKAEKLQKFVTDSEHIRVIVGAKQKGHRHFAEVYWHSQKAGKDFFAKEEGDHLYTQIDQIFEKITHQLQKEHDKTIALHHKKEPLKRMKL